MSALCKIYDHTYFGSASPKIFTPEYWQAKDAITGQAKGRGITWFFQHKGSELVLRHYYRGGMMRRFLTDLYLYRGLKHTRAYRECELLHRLVRLGLPVPKPIAFQVQKRHLFFCVSDIVMSRIVGATDLVSRLKERPMSAQEWRTVGQTIRRFHDHNVFHHDLNANNVLLDQNDTAWLVDFDQGEIRTHDHGWKRSNLQRLRMSLQKERARSAQFHWKDSEWEHVIAGYRESPARPTYITRPTYIRHASYIARPMREPKEAVESA